MKVENNNVVSVSYELKLEKGGEIIDTANETQPLMFMYNTGAMLPKFEENLKELVEGDSFDFMLNSTDGYGEYNEENVSDIPLEVFMQDGKVDDALIAVGNIIPLQDNQGQHFNGQVVSSNETSVKLDFNHPLAGKDLLFTGKVVSIREATAEEVAHGHVHQHHHQHGDGDCDGTCNH